MVKGRYPKLYLLITAAKLQNIPDFSKFSERERQRRPYRRQPVDNVASHQQNFHRTAGKNLIFQQCLTAAAAGGYRLLNELSVSSARSDGYLGEPCIGITRMSIETSRTLGACPRGEGRIFLIAPFNYLPVIKPDSRPDREVGVRCIAPESSATGCFHKL